MVSGPNTDGVHDAHNVLCVPMSEQIYQLQVAVQWMQRFDLGT